MHQGSPHYYIQFNMRLGVFSCLKMSGVLILSVVEWLGLIWSGQPTWSAETGPSTAAILFFVHQQDSDNKTTNISWQSPNEKFHSLSQNNCPLRAKMAPGDMTRM